MEYMLQYGLFLKQEKDTTKTTLKGKTMIKNFIYLDSEKLYSFASQIFEGVSENRVHEESKSKEEAEEQKGPIGSGNIIGDLIKNSNKTTEIKVIHDYLYTMFEKHLNELQKIIELPYKETSKIIDLKIIKERPFIKITSRVKFNDIKAIQQTIKNFNNIGVALHYVTSFSEIMPSQKNISQKDLINLAKSAGLQQDQKFLEYLSFLLNYGYQDKLELQFHANEKIFSTSLKREFLREKEDLLIMKYSRNTEVEFTALGIVTQSQKTEAIKASENSINSMKFATMAFLERLSSVEESFSGIMENEVIFDPIAIYTEIK